MNNAFRDGYVQTTGTGLTKILPPVSRFTASVTGGTKAGIRHPEAEKNFQPVLGYNK